MKNQENYCKDLSTIQKCIENLFESLPTGKTKEDRDKWTTSRDETICAINLLHKIENDYIEFIDKLKTELIIEVGNLYDSRRFGKHELNNDKYVEVYVLSNTLRKFGYAVDIRISTDDEFFKIRSLAIDGKIILDYDKCDTSTVTT